MTPRSRQLKLLLGRWWTGPHPVAADVWWVGGNPGRLRAYLIRDADGGVTLFDAGGAMMLQGLRRALGLVGPLERVVLSHAHTDHRGAANELGAPVYCHEDEVEDVEGSGGFRYWGEGLPKLPLARRLLHVHVLQPLYDAGGVRVAGVLRERDDVSGFRVVHLPGHAPGLIALHRERDGVALTSDAFYTVDDWWRDCPPYPPGPAWSLDAEAARRSLARLAELDLRAAWPGHGSPLTADVSEQLRRAATSLPAPQAPARSRRSRRRRA